MAGPEDYKGLRPIVGGALTRYHQMLDRWERDGRASRGDGALWRREEQVVEDALNDPSYKRLKQAEKTKAYLEGLRERRTRIESLPDFRRPGADRDSSYIAGRRDSQRQRRNYAAELDALRHDIDALRTEYDGAKGKADKAETDYAALQARVDKANEIVTKLLGTGIDDIDVGNVPVLSEVVGGEPGDYAGVRDSATRSLGVLTELSQRLFGKPLSDLNVREDVPENVRNTVQRLEQLSQKLFGKSLGDLNIDEDVPGQLNAQLGRLRAVTGVRTPEGEATTEATPTAGRQYVRKVADDSGTEDFVPVTFDDPVQIANALDGGDLYSVETGEGGRVKYVPLIRERPGAGTGPPEEKKSWLQRLDEWTEGGKKQ